MPSLLTSGCHKGGPSWLAKILNHAKIDEKILISNFVENFDINLAQNFEK
jgi:hypothetical protein